MIIKGAKVYTQNHIFEDGIIITDGMVIKDLCVRGQGEGKSGSYAADVDKEANADSLGKDADLDVETTDVLDASGLYAIPGLVDIHFHGAYGHDFCEADQNGLKEIAKYEAENGILAICPATMTYNEEILGGIMDVARDFVALQGGSCIDGKIDNLQGGNCTDGKISSLQGGNSKGEENSGLAALVGINMEGPFISPKRVGAQNPEYLMLPDVGMFKRLQERSGGLIKLVDIAPELDGSMEFIDELAKEVNISIAHTVCDYDTAVTAFDKGARHVTHLYNAMPGLTHREPGPIRAAMEKDAEVEMIADGVHIHPAMIRMAFESFSDDKTILISDSMEATGLPDGEYQLGGQKVTVEGNRAVLSGNRDTIAGSVTNLFKCMKTAIGMGVSKELAIRAATENPARSIGIGDRYGAIGKGYFANIVLVDENFEIRHIVNRGKLVK